MRVILLISIFSILLGPIREIEAYDLAKMNHIGNIAVSATTLVCMVGLSISFYRSAKTNSTKDSQIGENSKDCSQPKFNVNMNNYKGKIPETVQVCIELAKADPEKRKRLLEKRKQPICDLFIGPPGTGKSFLAQCILGECAGIPRIITNGANLDNAMLYGIGKMRIDALFKEAFEMADKHKSKACFIFIDEIDGCATSRHFNEESINPSGEHDLNSRIISILNWCDVVKSNKDVFVYIIGCTNAKKKNLEKAFISRIDSNITYFENPSEETLIDLFRHLLKENDVELKEIDDRTNGQIETLAQSFHRQKDISIRDIDSAIAKICLHHCLLQQGVLKNGHSPKSVPFDYVLDGLKDYLESRKREEEEEQSSSRQKYSFQDADKMVRATMINIDKLILGNLAGSSFTSQK